MSADPVDVLEACYRLDGTEDEWLRGVGEAAGPSLPRGIAVHVWTFRATGVGTAEVTRGLPVGAPPGYAEAVWDFTVAMGERMVAKGNLEGSPCKSMREALGDAETDEILESPVGRPLAAVGFRDLIGATICDPTGHGAGIGIALDHVWRPTVPFKRRWERVAAHVAAAHRARRVLRAELPSDATPTNVLDGAAAVLTPGGKVLHASDAAKAPRTREALQRAARAVDHARAGLRRRDPDAALDSWQALFAGRWSLVDVFDRDGRRFVVARRNDCEGPTRGGLSTREFQILAYRAQAHSLKLIAYECGLSIGTVATYLRTACLKLGVTSAVQIARLFTS